MAQKFRNDGSVDSGGISASYTDQNGAYMDYDSTNFFAQVGAKASASGSIGLKLRTILAGVATTVLTFTSAGAATFSSSVTTQALVATTGTFSARVRGSADAVFGPGAVPGTVNTLTFTNNDGTDRIAFGVNRALSGNGSTLTVGENYSSVVFAGALSGITTLTTSGAIISTASTSVLRTDTSDAADNKSWEISSAGAGADTRGAWLQLFGNESPGAGLIRIRAGDVAGGDIDFYTLGALVARFDRSTTAGQTRFLIYDVDNAVMERVTVGAADSGGVGFKVLRILN